MTAKDKGLLNTKLSRRAFLKAAGALGTVVAAPGFLRVAEASPDRAARLQGLTTSIPGPDPLETAPGVDIRYTSCLQCHNSCTISAKVVNGVVEKIGGNPYSPMNRALDEMLPYDTDPEEAKTEDGRICPKGQSLLQTTYDPYRVKQPLKRAGPRGSGKWQAISWEQAISEIVNGGSFPDSGPFEGLKAIRSFEPIDPDIPELGPKANQFVMMIGRAEHGRKDIIKKWVKDVFGSVNAKIEHTTICEQSHHIGIAHSLNYKDHHVAPDIENAEYIIFFGTSPLEANFGPPHLARKLSYAMVERGLKVTVVDPRFSKTAAKAGDWVPIKPGTDGALAMAMIRWIIENERYDATFLTNPNKDAAAADGETSWSDATYLVKIGDIEPDEPGAFLRADEVGVGTADQFVVMQDGVPVPADTATGGDLEVDTEINGIRVKSAFTLLREEAQRYTLDEYAEITGVPKATIERLADEFTSHGKKAMVSFYRGPVQHTNGFYTARALTVLNILIGNLDWKGGWQKGGGHYHELGGKPGNPYSMDDIVPKAPDAAPGGVLITREKKKYEDVPGLFERDGYPAKRPWFPFSSNVYQEVLPSAADAYPYPIKALFLVKGTPALACPASEEQRKILQDTKAIPLFIASDIVIGESSMYADYILPDVTILERWGFPHTSPDIRITLSKVRQPVIEKVYPDTKPVEEVLIDIAEALGIPGYGKGQAVSSAESFYLKMAANVALEEPAVPDATPEQMARFQWLRDRDPDAITDDEWKKVVYILARGCRVADPSMAYDGDRMGKKYANITRIYDEKTGTTRDSITGLKWSGLPKYEPVKDLAGNEIVDADFPLILITYKDILGGQSRTIGNEWLRQIWPENHILMHTVDAQARGLRTGDLARIISATNRDGVVGKVLVTEGVMPGVVAVSWHFGHWAYGARSFQIDGQDTGHEPARAAGLVPNPVMRVDESVGKVCLEDPIGGSASFYDTRVEVMKV
ncbi:MAG TPA: molybdopterin-dependent oxidoreductase [Caldilineae bacterium]|nr:molybdopterin-dependent oxidoreductase [Caldilineae bacterium]